jgi:hypothetical protein
MTWPREDFSGIAPIVLEGFVVTVEENFYRYVAHQAPVDSLLRLGRLGGECTTMSGPNGTMVMVGASILAWRYHAQLTG